MVYRDPKYGLPAAQDTDVVKTWPTLSRELVDDLAGLFSGSDSWVPWTPTLVGFTASSVSCVYRRTHGGLVVASAALTVSALTAVATVSLPVAATREAFGDAMILLSGTSYPGLVRVTAGGTVVNPMVFFTPAEGYARRAYMSPGVPAAWVAGATLNFNITYQCASQ